MNNSKPESGHRLYLKKKIAKKVEAKARSLGLSIDDYIIAKLDSNLENNSNNNQHIISELVNKTTKLEAGLNKVLKLLESGIIDTGYVRGAIEFQADSQAIERAESLEIRRSKFVSQVRQEAS